MSLGVLSGAMLTEPAVAKIEEVVGLVHGRGLAKWRGVKEL